MADHYLFWWQLILGVVTTVIFYTIPQPLRPGEIPPAESELKKKYAAPMGARACDQLCFMQTVARLSAIPWTTNVGTVEETESGSDDFVGIIPDVDNGRREGPGLR